MSVLIHYPTSVYLSEYSLPSFRPILQPPSGKPEVLSRVAPQTAVLQDLHKGRGKPSPATKLQQNPKPPGTVPREPSSLVGSIGRGSTSHNSFHKTQSASSLQQTSYSGEGGTNGMGVGAVGASGGGIGHGQPPKMTDPPRSRPAVLGRGRVSAASSPSSSADPSPAGSPARPAHRASPGRGRGLRHVDSAPGAISLSPARPGSSPGRGRGMSNATANKADNVVGNVGNASGEPFRGIGRGVFLD